MGLALAAPMAVPESTELEAASSAEPAEATGHHVDVLSWVHRESTTTMLQDQTEHDRTALLREGWQLRAPTWIQSTSSVNLGDFPMLDDPTARAERDLKTLEWVIEENRRLAVGKPTQAAEADAEVEAAQVDHWLRRLIPREWIVRLKANREWVAAGGTALLVIVWATAAFARRPTDGPAPPPPVERTRRRRRSHRHSTHAPSTTVSGTLPAGLPDTRYSRH
jgi:hypothetical protein